MDEKTQAAFLTELEEIRLVNSFVLAAAGEKSYLLAFQQLADLKRRLDGIFNDEARSNAVGASAALTKSYRIDADLFNSVYETVRDAGATADDFDHIVARFAPYLALLDGERDRLTSELRGMGRLNREVRAWVVGVMLPFLMNNRKPIAISAVVLIVLVAYNKIATDRFNDRHGLVATYYSDTSAKNFVDRGKVLDLNMNWKFGAPTRLMRQRGHRDWFATDIEGFLKVPVAGEYEFALSADDGGKVWINDQLVLQSNFWLDVPKCKVTLPEGVVPIRVTSYENNGGAKLIVSWRKPDDIEMRPLDRQYLFPKKEYALEN